MPYKYPEDLTGMQFGRLTAIRLSENKTKRNRPIWVCKCSCGNIVEKPRNSLLQGEVRSCGCLVKDTSHSKEPQDITGMISGDLTVLYMIPDTHPPRCMCQCACGNLVERDARRIRSQSVKSCGCGLHKLKNDLTGKTFGKLTVLERVENHVTSGGQNFTRYRCVCECGEVVDVNAPSLVRGLTTSCGCFLSHGEESIKNTLQKIGVSYKRQYSFEDCKDKSRLPLDFAIIDSNGSLDSLIEYDGLQHYVERPGWDIEYIRNHDEIKNRYCEKNHIPLLRIPYTKYNQLEVIIKDWITERKKYNDQL